VNTNGSYKESSEETSKEDRKEEIVSLPKHTPFWAGGEILQPSFCGLPRYKTLFCGKIQVKFATS
jgi:hypothetical protein